MIQEDKELLIKDLCSRLPYRVICHYDCVVPSVGKVINYDRLNGIVPIQDTIGFMVGVHTVNALFDNIKPYLRPMSSMTKEEMEELKSKCIHTETEEDWEGVRCDVWGIQIFDKYDTRRWDNPIWPSTINIDAIDWLNTHHFDYRGLIERGLALEAFEGMYKKGE